MTPSDRDARGLLERRIVSPTIEVYIGKESNRLEDAAAGLLHDQRESLATYTDVDGEVWEKYVRPALKDIPARWLAEQTGLSKRSIQRLRNGHAFPRRRHQAKLMSALGKFAEGGSVDRS